MSGDLTIPPEELRAFSVPHAVRLVGEYAHLVGTGAMAFACGPRVHVLVKESADEFALRIGPGEHDADVLADFAGRWRRVLGELAVPDPELLEGMEVTVDFGRLAEWIPTAVLLSTPALGVALAVAATSRRGQRTWNESELAELAGSLCHGVIGGPMGDTGRHYVEAVISLIGGASYVEPGRERLNVQQLLPPQSLLLALSPDPASSAVERCPDEPMLRALALTQQGGHNVLAGGEEGTAALFALPEGYLDEGQTTMLYGALRVREMTQSLLESIGDPLADNDRLAEVCDEESAILGDYFGFPRAAYAGVIATAAEVGAVGARLTWAFGACPAAVIIAPGARAEVASALADEFPGMLLLPLDVEPFGLLSDDGEEG